MNKEQDIKTTFDLLYKQYYDKSVLYVKSYVHDMPAAMDIASDSLIRLWEKMKEEEITNPQYLLISILRNKALDHLKHEAIKRKAFDNIQTLHQVDLDIRISTLESSVPESVFSAEIKMLVRNTLSTLPEQTRDIFNLSRFAHKSNKDIALKYNISVKAVEYHITKASKSLKIALKDYLVIFFLC